MGIAKASIASELTINGASAFAGEGRTLTMLKSWIIISP
jgi:hypothetical protein